MNKWIYIFGLFAGALFIFYSCDNPAIPKPQGFYRIDLPEVSFKSVEFECGLRIEKPEYSNVEIVNSDKSGDACWFNLRFKQFNARLHCTQVDVNGNLVELMEDAQEMVFSHDLKSNGISRIRVSNDDKGVNGVLYHIGGPVATPVQFFITDSSSRFLRGALYFNHTPNPDSTAPVVHRLIHDVEHLMKSISWE